MCGLNPIIVEYQFINMLSIGKKQVTVSGTIAVYIKVRCREIHLYQIPIQFAREIMLCASKSEPFTTDNTGVY